MIKKLIKSEPVKHLSSSVQSKISNFTQWFLVTETSRDSDVHQQIKESEASTDKETENKDNYEIAKIYIFPRAQCLPANIFIYHKALHLYI